MGDAAEGRLRPLREGDAGRAEDREGAERLREGRSGGEDDKGKREF